MLTGRLSEDKRQRLVSVLRGRAAKIADPGLRGVVDEIELRVAVELAKLGQSL